MNNKTRVLTCGALFLFATILTAAGQHPPADKFGYGVKKDYNVQIPMRDEVKLRADIYRPDSEGRFPVVVNRTPYGKSSRSA